MADYKRPDDDTLIAENVSLWSKHCPNRESLLELAKSNKKKYDDFIEELACQHKIQWLKRKIEEHTMNKACFSMMSNKWEDREKEDKKLQKYMEELVELGEEC